MTQTQFLDRNNHSIFGYQKVYNQKGEFFIVKYDGDFDNWVIENLTNGIIEKLSAELAEDLQIWNGDLQLSEYLNFLETI